MYRPLMFFGSMGILFLLLGIILGVRFLILGMSGHIQSLILASILILLGIQTIFMGFQADLIAANRKLLEEIQYRLRRRDADEGVKPMDLTAGYKEGKSRDTGKQT